MLNLEWTPIPTFVLTIGSCTCGIGGFYTNTLVDEETWDYLTCSSKERTASNALALHLNYLSHNYPILCVCCKCVFSLIISGTHELYSNTFVYWLVHLFYYSAGMFNTHINGWGKFPRQIQTLRFLWPK